MLKSDTPPTSQADIKTMSICSTVFSRFPSYDQDIIRAYYTCKWGDHVYAAEDYSARHGTPIPVIYSVLHKARYAVMCELGLVDPDKERR